MALIPSHNMADTVSVRVICCRVIVISKYVNGTTVTEMTLHEAMAVRAELDRAIAMVESGHSFSDDLTALLATI
jgi:hypothetical protein